MHIQSDRAFVPAGAPSTRYLIVTLAAPPARAHGPAGAGRAGVNVSLVLDRSGSMGGSKIELARKAVGHAVRLLKEHDCLSVVAYDHSVETVLEPLPATVAARRQALRRLDAIDARGSTNLGEGWLTGARALAGQVAPDRVSRVLLLTDGLANLGITEPAALRKLAAGLREQGISTSAFGLGADFDEELLHAIASEGGGHFYFIEQPLQIPDFFASELGEVLDIVVRDAVFEVQPGPGAAVKVLNGMPAEEAGLAVRVPLGDLVAEQEVIAMLAVQLPPCVEGGTVSVDCRVRDRDGVLHPHPMRVEWTAVDAEQDRQQAVDQAVLNEIGRTLAEQARRRALAANRLGRFTQADQAFDDAMGQIDRLGLEAESVAAIVSRLQAERPVFAAEMSASDRKRRHFASYNAAHSREHGKARKRHS